MDEESAAFFLYRKNRAYLRNFTKYAEFSYPQTRMVEPFQGWGGAIIAPGGGAIFATLILRISSTARDSGAHYA